MRLSDFRNLREGYMDEISELARTYGPPLWLDDVAIGGQKFYRKNISGSADDDKKRKKRMRQYESDAIRDVNKLLEGADELKLFRQSYLSAASRRNVLPKGGVLRDARDRLARTIRREKASVGAEDNKGLPHRLRIKRWESIQDLGGSLGSNRGMAAAVKADKHMGAGLKKYALDKVKESDVFEFVGPALRRIILKEALSEKRRARVAKEQFVAPNKKRSGHSDAGLYPIFDVKSAKAAVRLAGKHPELKEKIYRRAAKYGVGPYAKNRE